MNPQFDAVANARPLPQEAAAPRANDGAAQRAKGAGGASSSVTDAVAVPVVDETTADDDSTAGTIAGVAAVDRIDVKLAAPQTYQASVEILGWQNPYSGIVVLRVVDASLLGAIDALTGQPTGHPYESERDHAERLIDLVILSSTAGRARSKMLGGSKADVRLVLLPVSGSATFVVDRVE